jgi:hypothetical protein
MRIYLVRIPHREDHSIQSDVLLAWASNDPGRRIQDLVSSWPKRERSQAASRQLRSNNRAAASHPQYPLCFIRFDSPSSLTTIPLTWAEDRATAGKQPERRPRGQHPMGRHDAALFHWGLALSAKSSSWDSSVVALPHLPASAPWGCSLSLLPASARARHWV